MSSAVRRRVIVALPAYNEEVSLPPLLRSFKRLALARPEIDLCIIIVDDGSRDRTAAVAEAAAKSIPVHLVRHGQNKGLGEAIKTGFRAALELSTSDEDVLVCMDADDTHPPRHIPSMLEQVDRGADIVIASRYRRGSRQHGVPLFRQLLSLAALVVFSLVLRIRGVRDYTCGYRAYRMGLIRRGMGHYGDRIITRGGFACTDQVLLNLACLGARIREVPFILRYDRKRGASKIRLGLTILETLHMLREGRSRLNRAGQ